jgi:uncharacterized protein
MKRSGFADLPLHGGPEKLSGFRRLEVFARTIEKRFDPQADFNAAVAHENAISKALGGRSVYDDLKEKTGSSPKKQQLKLF